MPVTWSTIFLGTLVFVQPRFAPAAAQKMIEPAARIAATMRKIFFISIQVKQQDMGWAGGFEDQLVLV